MTALIIDQGPDKGQALDLVSDYTTIGCRKNNDIFIDDKSISGLHCLIRKEGTNCYLKDLGSKQGTSLNQETIDNEVPLKPGDKITLGEVILVFQCDEKEEATSTEIPVKEPASEQRTGKGYGTVLGETLKSIREEDLDKAFQKAQESSEILKDGIQRFGWDQTQAYKVTGDETKKDETFSSKEILSVEKPKENERVISLKHRIKGLLKRFPLI